MGKSRAEIQRAYRERQKFKGPAFLSKERARQRQNYVPASHLSIKNREARNNKAKLRNRLSRLRKRTRENNVEETRDYGSMSMETGDDDDEGNQPTEQRALIVKLSLTKKGQGAKKINARALSRAQREFKSLKSEVIQLRKKIKIKNRKIDRINNKTKSYAFTSHELTPMKKTEAEVSRLNLTPQSRKLVRRKLLTGNVLMAEIEKAKRESGKKKVANIYRVISGQIAKKYRILNQISQCIRLSRRSLGLIEDKTIVMVKEKRRCITKSVGESVIDFLGREDNCRIQPENEILLQMDFAENFSCRSLDEIQTAYFSQTQVTLHPAVCNFKENDELKHKSFVVVSDETSHAASTVCAFLDKLIPAIKTLKLNLSTIHYWTDSQSSQYKNRYIFHTIAMHKDMYGIQARWSYFETGHGKSACDGHGGTTKRMADEAIRQGNATIQDAADFYAWAVQSSMTAVEFLYVSSDVTKTKRDNMALIKTKPVKGTLNLHAVGIKLEDNKTKLMTREMLCHCATCIAGSYCDSWAAQDIKCVTAVNEERADAVDKTLGETEKDRQPGNDKDLPDTEEGAHGVEETLYETEKNNEDNIVLNDIHVDDLVAAVYEGQWYIGRVVKK